MPFWWRIRVNRTNQWCRRRRRVILTQNPLYTETNITRQQVLAVCIEQELEEEFIDSVIEDVLQIVNCGFRYPPRRRQENVLYFPEDFSLEIARRFGVDGRYPSV